MAHPSLLPALAGQSWADSCRAARDLPLEVLADMHSYSPGKAW